jgi:DNA-binding transcriptional LysR family regulator
MFRAADKGMVMSHLPDFMGWAIFAKVVERGSFALAAEELGLTNTTVSKSVSRLEDRLCTTLLHRTTRRLSLTESGRVSLDLAQRILNDGNAVEAGILEAAAVPRGTVRLSCPVAFGVHAVAPRLPSFMRAYPDVTVDLDIGARKPDLIGQGFDVAIHVGPAPDSTLRISRLTGYRMALVASPGLLEACGHPTHPSELATRPAVIHTDVADGEEWRFVHPADGPEVVRVTGAVRVNSSLAAVPALLAGAGFALQPVPFVWSELQSGRLVEVLPEWSTPAQDIYILTPPDRARPARVRVLIEFLKREFGREPWFGADLG